MNSNWTWAQHLEKHPVVMYAQWPQPWTSHGEERFPWLWKTWTLFPGWICWDGSFLLFLFLCSHLPDWGALQWHVPGGNTCERKLDFSRGKAPTVGQGFQQMFPAVLILPSSLRCTLSVSKYPPSSPGPNFYIACRCDQHRGHVDALETIDKSH